MLDFATNLLIPLFGNTTTIFLPSLSFPLPPLSPFRFGPTAIGPCAHEQKAHMAYMHHEFSRHWLQIGCICDLDLKHTEASILPNSINLLRMLTSRSG